jgi:hypothetical protein
MSDDVDENTRLIKVSFTTKNGHKEFYLIRGCMFKNEKIQRGSGFSFEKWNHEYGPPIKQIVPDIQEEGYWDNP